MRCKYSLIPWTSATLILARKLSRRLGLSPTRYAEFRRGWAWFPSGSTGQSSSGCCYPLLHAGESTVFRRAARRDGEVLGNRGTSRQRAGRPSAGALLGARTENRGLVAVGGCVGKPGICQPECR